MSADSLNLLVLGVSGNVSQGILKALALSTLRCRVVAACSNAGALGLFTADRAYISPLAQDPGFIPWLMDVCKKERIHAVLSGVEAVLEVLAKHREEILAATGAVCLVNAPQAMEIGADKAQTCEWLREHGFNYPRFAVSEDGAAIRELVRAVGFPLIAKPRRGKGSAGIHMISSQEELDRIRESPDYVVQEVLGDAATEYTVACFSDREDVVRGIIVFHRQLLHGTTVSARAGLYEEVRAEAARIAAALKARGPCNVQMRMHRSKPVCFELNVRFSGTTPMRARLGFNDVEAAIRHYVLGEPAVDLPLVTRGLALRYWNEAYVEPEALGLLEAGGCLQDPAGYPVEMENYGLRS